MTSTNSARVLPTRFSAAQRSRQGTDSPAGPALGSRHITHFTATRYIRMPSTPGMKPAANSSRMLVSVRMP